ncbi:MULTISPECIES: helix-turn-helix domain-containing protein [Pectobacterium]|uniref:Helix-turn-helix domain-containing protein n=1 Tax=Pectobacterium parvum TaxID=2778550 RepID=A0AAP9LC35_9GAMM|nr:MULTISPECIES: helix-turn-helix transcriptional regulator [Pectobacterium]GKW43214.1 transcriptional regulator [Pectobacterium carotovorum subsp. carotovorum]KFX11213.1 2-hydroxyacid dehydrogenase [Pectobacterium parvum]KHS91971.1 2-hydroxyacid dehydrogenase [Pectobacterium parvum]MBN3216914.1 helix-turn-helix transcriptional regulator [Pectobacterium polaris]MCU1803172.1 XRE family transcriptional regulator [Pectobacterium parvum]
MSKPQFINDMNGQPQFVVLPISEYEKLLSDSDSGYEDIPYVADEYDNETVPNDVVEIMFRDDVSLLAAWRIHRGLSQYDVAEKLGTTQSAVSQWEAKDSRPQKKTRAKLSEIYHCRPEQMIL